MIPYTESVTVTTRTKTGVDAYGDPIYSTVSTVSQGIFQPSTGSKITASGDVVTSQPQVLFTGQPADDVAAIVTSDSQVTVRGRTYIVDGEPGDWLSPTTGRRAGLQIPLKLVTGGA